MEEIRSCNPPRSHRRDPIPSRAGYSAWLLLDAVALNPSSTFSEEWHMLARLKPWIRVGALLLSGGCMSYPYDGKLLDTPYDPVFFGGLTRTPGAVIIIEAYNQKEKRYEALGQPVAS